MSKRTKAFITWGLQSLDRAIRWAVIAAVPAAAMGTDAIDIVSINVMGAVKMAAGAAVLSLLRSIYHMPSLVTGELDTSEDMDGNGPNYPQRVA